MHNKFDDLSEFQKQYIHTLLWSSGEVTLKGTDDEVEYNFGQLDLLVLSREIDLTDTGTREHMESVQDFYRRYKGIWTDYWGDTAAAHDLALTRNGHGTGFWDRFYRPWQQKPIPSFTSIGTTSSLIPKGVRLNLLLYVEGAARGKILTQAAKLEGACYIWPIEAEYLPYAELHKQYKNGKKVFDRFIIM